MGPTWLRSGRNQRWFRCRYFRGQVGTCRREGIKSLSCADSCAEQVPKVGPTTCFLLFSMWAPKIGRKRHRCTCSTMWSYLIEMGGKVRSSTCIISHGLTTAEFGCIGTLKRKDQHRLWEEYVELRVTIHFTYRVLIIFKEFLFDLLFYLIIVLIVLFYDDLFINHV